MKRQQLQTTLGELITAISDAISETNLAEQDVARLTQLVLARLQVRFDPTNLLTITQQGGGNDGEISILPHGLSYLSK